MTAKHTRGPWAVFPVEDDKDYLRVRGTRLGARFKIANVLRLACNDWEAEEAAANARLIAAAPDLLGVLVALADSAGQWTESSEALRVAHFQARAAIAKATGEQQ